MLVCWWVVCLTCVLVGGVLDLIVCWWVVCLCVGGWCACVLVGGVLDLCVGGWCACVLVGGVLVCWWVVCLTCEKVMHAFFDWTPRTENTLIQVNV